MLFKGENNASRFLHSWPGHTPLGAKGELRLHSFRSLSAEITNQDVNFNGGLGVLTTCILGTGLSPTKLISIPLGISNMPRALAQTTGLQSQGNTFCSLPNRVGFEPAS